MSEPITIHECPDCGLVYGDTFACIGPLAQRHDPVMTVEVRVFREEDVRPLWEAATLARQHLRYSAPEDVNPRHDDEVASITTRIHAFPAPEEWKR